MFSLVSGKGARPEPAVPGGGEEAPDRSRLPAAPHQTAVFHGGKGGVGTTTLASEAAAILAGSGRGVVAVDLDLYRGDLNYRLDVPATRDTHTFADLLPVLGELDARILDNALSRCRCGARMLPAPVSPGEASTIEPDHVRRLLKALTGEFEQVIVDTPVAGDQLAPALESADLLVLVVTPEVSCLGGARRVLDSVFSTGGKRPDLALVVNRSLGASDAVSASELESFLQRPATAVLPEDTSRCRRLADEGRLITSERSSVGHGIAALVRSLFALP